jgi:hypothetical protein
VSGEGGSKAKLRVNVREAKDSDRDAVFEFCRPNPKLGRLYSTCVGRVVEGA